MALLATWACGLIWGFGELTYSHGLLSSLYGEIGLAKEGAPLGWTPQQGFVAMAIGPTLLGFLLWRNWRGLLGGALAFLAGLLTPLIWWIGTSIALTLASRLPEVSDYDIAEKALTSWSPYVIAQVVVTVLAIGIVIMTNAPSSPQRDHSLRAGSKVGLVLVLASFLGVIIAQQFAVHWWYTFIEFQLAKDPILNFVGLSGRSYATDAMSFFLWQIPPLIWMSVVYFLQPTERRRRPAAIAVWCLLVIVTWLLPVI